MSVRIDVYQEAMFVDLQGQVVRLGFPIKALSYSKEHDFGKTDNLAITIPQVPRALLLDPEGD